MDYESALMEKVAWYYYFENMTQNKIAELLSISRMRVIKLLEKARTTGVIQFHLKRHSDARMHLEQQILDLFQLKDVFLVPPLPNSDASEINASIAKAAAMYICDALPDKGIINIGYGDTPGRVLNHLATMVPNPISCVSLTGGVSYYLPDTRSSTFNARLFLMPLPLLAANKEMAEVMRTEVTFNELSRMIHLSSFTVVGVGAMDESATIIKSGILGLNDFVYLRMKGAVGDVLCHFIDKDGQLIDTPIEDRLIATSLDTLKQLDNVIAVAAGEKKTEAIYAALCGRYFDILITDEPSAQRLVELATKDQKEKNDI
ncbi:MAG: sugar-binding transcriptional regulator [Clostridiales bacterium]|nr:sugar-binding transcriptional regulator [Clostridiales bacterium]